MTESTSGAPADTGATNLDDILGQAPIDKVKDPIESEVEETADEIKQEDKEPEKKVLVPHGAFHEERERRKELQKQLTEEKAARERLEERQNKIFEMMEARKAEPQEEQFIDPLAKIESKVNEVIDKVNKKHEAETAEAKNVREENELIQRFSASAQAFSKDIPEFNDAYNHLLAARQRELAVMGNSQAEINQILRAEEKFIVSKAYKDEKNPAEIMYNLSKERGFKPAASASKKTVEDIDKGLKASKSLGSGGSKAGDKDDLESMSAADLAEMTQDEFDSFFTKIEKQANKRH